MTQKYPFQSFWYTIFLKRHISVYLSIVNTLSLHLLTVLFLMNNHQLLSYLYIYTYFAWSPTFSWGYFLKCFCLRVRFTFTLPLFSSLCASTGLAPVDECIGLLYFFNVGLFKSVHLPFVKRILSATPFLIVLIRHSTIFPWVLVVFCTIPSKFVCCFWSL